MSQGWFSMNRCTRITWLVALLLVAALVHAQPYPRIGAYLGVKSGGQPLTRADGSIDSAMHAKTARFPKVAIDMNALLIAPNIVPTLVHFRPDIEVSAYYLVTHWYLPDTFVVASWDKTFAAYWHNDIKATGGFIPGAPLGYEVNIGQKSTVDSLAALALWGIRRLRVQGFFGDYFSPEVAWARVGNEFTDRARVSNLQRWVARLKQGMGPAFRVYANGTGAAKTGADGTMMEGYPNVLTSFTQALTQKDGDWLKAEHVPGTNGDPRTVRFLLGTACLTGATATYGKQEVTTPWQSELWFHEYSVDAAGMPDPTGRSVGWLGFPLGAAAKLSSGIYVRFFQHGLVLVNPTATTITTDTIYPRWKRIGSSLPERTFSVGANDALFLWGD